MKKIMGLVITIAALIGGGGYVYDKVLAAPEEVSVNTYGAGQFAGAFLTNYFTYREKQGFDSIVPYTNLPDKRRANGSELVSMRVLSAAPQLVTQLAGTYMNAQVLIEVETIRKDGKDESGRTETQRDTYSSSVRVVETEKGFSVVQYPVITPFEKVADAKPDLPPELKNDVVEETKPFLDAFFRSYFAVKTPEELSSFFASKVKKPVPIKGELEYKQLGEVKTYNLSPSILVYATVQVRNPGTNVEYPMTFEVFLNRENEKFVITEFTN